jgi:hypothetical protein
VATRNEWGQTTVEVEKHKHAVADHLTISEFSASANHLAASALKIARELKESKSFRYAPSLCKALTEFFNAAIGNDNEVDLFFIIFVFHAAHEAVNFASVSPSACQGSSSSSDPGSGSSPSFVQVIDFDCCLTDLTEEEAKAFLKYIDEDSLFAP